MKMIMRFLILVLFSTSANAADSEVALLKKGLSIASSESGGIVIEQVVRLLERSIQQADTVSLWNLWAVGNGYSTDTLLPLEFKQQVSDLLAANSDGSAPVPGWRLTSFRGFRFRVDSVDIRLDAATAFLHPTWSCTGLSPKNDSLIAVNLARHGVRWSIYPPEQVTDLLHSYLNTAADLISLQPRASRHDRPQVSERTTSSVPHAFSLLRPVAWSSSPSIPRATWSQSQAYLSGQKLFGCVSSVSSYVFLDAADFAADLVAASDECWRRIVVVDDHPDHSYIVSKGHHGTGATADEFCAPRGMEFSGPSYLYVAEDYNNRIKILSVSTLSNDHVELFKFITRSELNHPQDLDVMPADQFAERRLVVANTGGNNILAMIDEEPSGPGAPIIHNGVGTNVGAFNKPISISFGRNPLTSEKKNSCYFIDSGNKRIVLIGNAFADPFPTGCSAYSDFPDPRTDLSSIGVDNKGEVWVVDRGLGRIYKFTSGLVPIATHGMTGTADGEYLHPTSISFSEGYEYGVGPIANLGEVVLGEEWGEDTGIRRLVSGTEIFDAHLSYNPRLVDGTSARLSGDYFITGYSNLTEQYVMPNGSTYTSTFNMCASGMESFNFTLPAGSPSGTYQVKIKAQSIYQNSNTDSVALSISVDTSAVNQLPVVSCIHFQNGDTCFLPNVSQPIMATAYDVDGTIADYFWSCYPSSAGNFSNPYTNPTSFTANPWLERTGFPRLVRLQVTDNYGQYSNYRSVDIDQCPTTQCVCTSCGDANSDGAIDIADAVFLITYIFKSGAAPAACNYAVGMGDANGDYAVDIADAVFLITYIFKSGAAPHCQGM